MRKVELTPMAGNGGIEKIIKIGQIHIYFPYF